MRVFEWGISFWVRFRAAVVAALDLKERDEIGISTAGKGGLEVARDHSKERAIEQLRQMKWAFPPDFKFDREQVNQR